MRKMVVEAQKEVCKVMLLHQQEEPSYAWAGNRLQ